MQTLKEEAELFPLTAHRQQALKHVRGAHKSHPTTFLAILISLGPGARSLAEAYSQTNPLSTAISPDAKGAHLDSAGELQKRLQKMIVQEGVGGLEQR